MGRAVGSGARTVGIHRVTRHQVGSRNPDTRFDRTCSSVRVYGPEVTVVQKRKKAAASEPIQPAEGQRQPLWVLRCRRTNGTSLSGDATRDGVRSSRKRGKSIRYHGRESLS